MRLFIPLRPQDVTSLHDLALREQRTPQQQAALLLTRALATENAARPPDAGLARPAPREGANHGN